MKKRSLFITAIVLAALMLLSLTVLAAPQRYGVTSKIGGTQYGATRELGSFIISAGGSASAFQGSAHVISSAANQAVGYSFSIEKIGYGSEKDVIVFERSWDGKKDSPVALANLTLGPGHYVLLVGGRPGSRADISFTGVNVKIEYR